MILYICNTVAVGLFGIILSAAFCNIRWDRKNVLWLALVIVAVFSGGDRMQYIAEMALTIPLLILLLRAAPAVRSVSRYSTAVQCQFGSIPALYYAFDYLTRVYTDLLESGSPVVVEFMPFVCCVAYIIFVVRLSAEQRARTHLEQLQSSLNLQVNQAVREIEGLRESQRKTRAYRHDLRHHLQYLDACAESDLCVLLSNALENALHACAGLEHGSIVVQTYVQSEKFFLQVVNDCPGPVQFNRGVPVTDRRATAWMWTL